MSKDIHRYVDKLGEKWGDVVYIYVYTKGYKYNSPEFWEKNSSFVIPKINKNRAHAICKKFSSNFLGIF